MIAAARQSVGAKRGGDFGAVPLLWAMGSIAFALVVLHLAANRYVHSDLTALWNATGAGDDGVWLSIFVVELADRLPSLWAQTALSLAAAVAAGLLLALLYVKLTLNDWPRWQAALIAVSLGGNALILYAATAAVSIIPLVVACILLAPNVRRLESVGDVQAVMGLGLVLPFFILAGPHTAPLVPIGAAVSALLDREARRDMRAFAAMFLVAIMPSLIVIAGLSAIQMRSGGALVELLAPYRSAYASDAIRTPLDAFAYLCLFAPVLLAPIAYCLTPDRRRQPVSALTVIAVPLYLAAGRALFGWTINAWAPAIVLLACFGAWLSVSRLRPLMRGFALALSLLSAASSWAFIDRCDATWRQALFSADITSRAIERCRPGLTPDAACDQLRGRLIESTQ